MKSGIKKCLALCAFTILSAMSYNASAATSCTVKFYFEVGTTYHEYDYTSSYVSAGDCKNASLNYLGNVMAQYADVAYPPASYLNQVKVFTFSASMNFGGDHYNLSGSLDEIAIPAGQGFPTIPFESTVVPSWQPNGTMSITFTPVVGGGNK